MGRMFRNPATTILLLTLGLLGGGCATTHPSHPKTGQSGHVEWEVICCVTFGYSGWSFTVVLRETAGVIASFTSVKLSVPFSSSGQGREYGFVHTLEPHASIRQ